MQQAHHLSEMPDIYGCREIVLRKKSKKGKGGKRNNLFVILSILVKSESSDFKTSLRLAGNVSNNPKNTILATSQILNQQKRQL